MSTILTEVARTPAGQTIVADSFRVYPARWREVHSALGSINDRFSIVVTRIGRNWVIPGPGLRYSQQRWSFEKGAFIAAHTFGPETYCEDLDRALAVAARLCEESTNIRGETFAQIVDRLLDNPDLSHPDVQYINRRKTERA